MDSNNIITKPSVNLFNIPKEYISVQPMSPPSGILWYNDYLYTTPAWIDFFEKIPVAIRVTIKDYFDNILEFFEREDIIVAKIIKFKVDTKTVAEFNDWDEDRNFLKDILGMSKDDYTKTIKRLGVISNCFGDPIGPRGKSGDEYNLRKTNLIETEFILEVPNTAFTKMYNVKNRSGRSNYNCQLDDAELALENGISCKQFIEYLYTNI